MIILDTHIWVRWLDPKASPLPASIQKQIELADQLAVSAISCWEVAWLAKRGRINLSLGLGDWIQLALAESCVTCLAIDQQIAICAANLPEHHRDPADRLIIASAIHHRASLISLDSEFVNYEDLSGLLIQ